MCDTSNNRRMRRREEKENGEKKPRGKKVKELSSGLE
jgi:hypothetical protein